MKNNVGRITTDAKAAELDYSDEIFNDVSADRWINVADDNSLFISAYIFCLLA